MAESGQGSRERGFDWNERASEIMDHMSKFIPVTYPFFFPFLPLYPSPSPGTTVSYYITPKPLNLLEFTLLTRTPSRTCSSRPRRCTHSSRILLPANYPPSPTRTYNQNSTRNWQIFPPTPPPPSPPPVSSPFHTSTPSL